MQRLFHTTNWFSKEVSVTPEEKKKSRQNRRTGLILLSVAAVFFIGILIRKVMEPSILNLMN
ncbi:MULTISPECIES: cytochrome oxidase small assembly protein [unclassified Limnobacter]|uniref:cytochrome oxidase small assembly protein n=1 Tax=unclassified Limnobacter TaxID=2630203 RepID=UPI00352FC03E